MNPYHESEGTGKEVPKSTILLTTATKCSEHSFNLSYFISQAFVFFVCFWFNFPQPCNFLHSTKDVPCGMLGVKVRYPNEVSPRDFLSAARCENCAVQECANCALDRWLECIGCRAGIIGKNVNSFWDRSAGQSGQLVTVWTVSTMHKITLHAKLCSVHKQNY